MIGLCLRLLGLLALLLALFLGAAFSYLGQFRIPEAQAFAIVSALLEYQRPGAALLPVGPDFADSVLKVAPLDAADWAARPAAAGAVPLKSGARMPQSGLGMCCRPAAYEFEAVYRQVMHFLKLGGRLVDTADVYSNHAAISLALHTAMQPKAKGSLGLGLKREELFVVSKIFPSYFGRETVKRRVREFAWAGLRTASGKTVEMGDKVVSGKVKEAVEGLEGKMGEPGSAKEVIEQLRRLQPLHLTNADPNSLLLPYIDLVLIHAPIPMKSAAGLFLPKWLQGPLGIGDDFGLSKECKEKKLDFKGCREDTWLGLSELVREGVVKDIGVSNYQKYHMEEVYDVVKRHPKVAVEPSVNQFKWNPWAPQWQRDVYDFCVEKGVAVMAYGSLGMSMQKKKAASSAAVLEIAEESGRTPQQVLLRWALQQRGLNASVPSTVVIPGSSKPRNMEANLGACAFELGEAQMRKLDAQRDAPEAADFMYERFPA